MNAPCNCYYPGDCDGSCTHPEPKAQRITDLRIALNDIIALDHHWHGPESLATEIARAALLRDDDAMSGLNSDAPLRAAWEAGRKAYCPAGILEDAERTEREWQQAKASLLNAS